MTDRKQQVYITVTHAIALMLLFGLLISNIQATPIDVTIPIVMNKCNVPSIQVRLTNGKDIWLAVDTGSTYTHLDRKYRQTTNKIHLLINDTIQVAVSAHYADYSKQHGMCGKIEGVMGNDVFSAARRVVIDYEQNLLVLTY